MTEVLEPHLSDGETIQEVFIRDGDNGDSEQVIAITDKRLIGWRRDEREEEVQEPPVETVDAIPLANVGATQVRHVEREPIGYTYLFFSVFCFIGAAIYFVGARTVINNIPGIPPVAADVIAWLFLIAALGLGAYAFIRDDGYVELSVSSPGSGVTTSFEFPEDEYGFAAKVNEEIAQAVS